MSWATDYYPPGLEPPGSLASGATHPRWELSGDAAHQLATRLRERNAAFRRLPVSQVLETLDRVHQQWAAAESPLRTRAVEALHVATGYPPALLDPSLRSLFASMQQADLERWLRHSGLTEVALDGFVPEAHGARTGVFGPALTVLVSSGNIPGAALPSLVQALLLKSPCLAKTSSSEPFLLPLYAHSLAEQSPELGAMLAVTGWEGGRTEIESRILAQAGALVAYGGDAALLDLRGQLPAHARFIGYGHRISFTALARECLTRAAAPGLAAEVARDAAYFDQQGCLSPQAVYVERGEEVDPGSFAELVARELERLAEEYPRRELSAPESSTIHQFRATAEMRAILGEEVRVWSSTPGTGWTVALLPEPALEPCPLNRTVLIRPLADLGELPPLLQVHPGHLISAGLEVGTERAEALIHRLAEAGVTRITRAGRAQFPETPLFHDGINSLAALARVVRIENG